MPVAVSGVAGVASVATGCGEGAAALLALASEADAVGFSSRATMAATWFTPEPGSLAFGVAAVARSTCGSERDGRSATQSREVAKARPTAVPAMAPGFSLRSPVSCSIRWACTETSGSR